MRQHGEPAGRHAATRRVRTLLRSATSLVSSADVTARVGALALATVVVGLTVLALGGERGGAQAALDERGREALAAYGRLPLSFVENRGQADGRVRYQAQGPRYTFHFTRSQIALSFLKQAPSRTRASAEGVALALRFLGANRDVALEGEDPAPGRVNYLRGDDPKRWRTALRTYRTVVYRELWRGIDMLVSGRDGQLKYEFRVRPGARPADIRLAYAGADGVAVDRDGALALQTPMGKLRDAAPVAYQQIDGRRVPVDSRYAIDDAGADPRYGFALGSYRTDRELVIDPGVEYSTFLGGASDEDGNGIDVDADGSAYIVGTTQSSDLPTTTGAFDRSFAGGVVDVFVSKLNAAGSALVYSTYLGGTPTPTRRGTGDPFEFGRAIAVDGNGNAYVTGQTTSSDFPTTSGAFDTSLSVGSEEATDAFVTKLNATGSGLAYSTFLGGTSRDDGRAIALDAQNNAYVAGETTSSDFPTTDGAFDRTRAGGVDSYVTKLNAAGSAVAYSTYLGGADNETAGDVQVDSQGSAYVAGGTRSAEFPTTAGAFQPTHNGGGFGELFDGFVTKLNATGSGLVYSTFLGGSNIDRVGSLAIDAAGNAYAVGGTLSPEFPTTEGALDRTPGPRSDGLQGTSDVFVTKLDPTGSGLVYSTFMSQSSGADIALDADNNAWLVGSVSATNEARPENVLTTPDAWQPQFGGGGGDATVAKINAAGSELLYATFLGGSSSEGAGGVALDPAGDVYVVGSTVSADFPTTTGAFDRVFGGDPSLFWGDAFVTKFTLTGAGHESPPPRVAVSSLSLDPTSVTSGGSSTATVTLTAAAPAGGASVALQSGNTSAATVPPSVTVPAGATSATFTVSANNVTSDTASSIAATYGAITRRATLTVTAGAPAPAALSSISLSPTSVAGGSPSTGTVTLSAAAPSGGASVALQSSNASAATVPSSVTVAAGATSATFTVATSSVSSDTSSTISATYDGVTRSATLTVTAPAPPEPAPRETATFSGRLAENQTVGHTVSVGAQGPVDMVLDWDDTRASVSLRARAPSGDVVFFDGTTAKPKRGTFTAGVAGDYRFEVINNTNRKPRYTLSVTRPVASAPAPPPAELSSLALNPASVTGGASSTGTVTLSSAAPTGGASVALQSSNTSAATLPASVTVAAGATSATFTVSTTSVGADTSSTISAAYAGVTRSATLAVTAPLPAPAALASLSVDPASVTGGSSSTGTVTLTAAAPSGGASVALQSSDTSVATVPSSLTVPAGDTSATFTVATSSVTSDTSSTISAVYDGTTRTATLAVTTPVSIPDPAALSSLTLDPASVTGGTSSTGTVTLTAAAPSGGASVALQSSNTSAATVPSSVTVPAGATAATFTVATSSVSADTSSSVTASYEGVTRSATLVITAPAATPAALSSLALSPASVAGGTSSTGTVTLTAAAPSGGASVALQSSNASAATVPSSVTVPAGATAATFAVATSSVSADTSSTISATYEGVTRSATLTVTAPAPSTDTVSISRAEYDTQDRELEVRASSSASGATLRVHVTSTDALIGTLSGGRGIFSWPSNPVNITVRSSLGGEASRAVTTG